MKHKYILAASLITALFFSCAHQTVFSATGSSQTLKPGTLAILPGCNFRPETVIIEYLNRSPEMRKIGPFELIPYDEYKDKIKREWMTTSPYTYERDNQFGTDFSQVDRRKIKTIFDEVGTDYIYILWTPGASAHIQMSGGKYASDKMYYDLHVFGMLFSKEDPEHELGVTDYSYSEKQPESCCFLFPAPQWGEELDTVMQPKMDEKARELAAWIRNDMIRQLSQ